MRRADATPEAMTYGKLVWRKGLQVGCDKVE